MNCTHSAIQWHSRGHNGCFEHSTFKFLFHTQYKVLPTAQHCIGRTAGACVEGSFEINQAQLMLQLLNKRQSWGTSLWTSTRSKLVCFWSNKYCTEHSGHAAIRILSENGGARKKKEPKDPSVVKVKIPHWCRIWGSYTGEWENPLCLCKSKFSLHWEFYYSLLTQNKN